MTRLYCNECNVVTGRKYEAVGGDDGGWSERNDAAKHVRKWWEIMKWTNTWPGGIWPRHILYYHRSTFFQLNTITFLLPFPNVFFPLELSGSRRNDSNSMSTFLFEDILLIVVMQKVLDTPFCNLPKCCIQSPITLSPRDAPCKFGTNRDATKTRHILWAEIEILVALLFHPRRSLNTGNFALISLRTRI